MSASQKLLSSGATPKGSSPSLNTLYTPIGEFSGGRRVAMNVTWRFDSLASKVLCLRYPYDTPMFDGNAHRAPWVLQLSEQSHFSPAEYYNLRPVHRGAEPVLWLPPRCDRVDISDYPYRVRIFDTILWMLGAPTYTLPI